MEAQSCLESSSDSDSRSDTDWDSDDDDNDDSLSESGASEEDSETTRKLLPAKRKMDEWSDDSDSGFYSAESDGDSEIEIVDALKNNGSICGILP
jgi:hypothetical protein